MPLAQVHMLWQMWPVFAAAAVIVILYCSGRYQVAQIGFGIIVSFLVFFLIFPVKGPDGTNLLGPDQLLQGFANPALVTIMALLILGQGLFQSGALDIVVDKLVQLSGAGLKRTLFSFFLTVFLLSAIVNDTPVVVMFLPILTGLAGRLRLPASRVVMPLSYVAVLGGMMTLMGTSTNILAAGAAEHIGGIHIGFFDQTPIAICLSLAGLAYVTLVAPRLLPTRAGFAEETFDDGKQFLVQIGITPGNPLIGAVAVSGMFTDLQDLTVRMILRGEHAFLPPFEDVALQAGDRLIVAATRKSITNFMTSSPQVLTGMIEGAQEELEIDNRRVLELRLSEVVISPTSRMIGRTIEEIGFHRVTGSIALGVQRRSRMIGSAISEIRLEAGDVLLVLGTRQAIRDLRASRDVLLLDWQTSDLPTRMFAARARLIFGLVILLAATGVAPMVTAALIGAGLMILTGVLSFRQALRAFDIDIVFLVASSIALATALEATGGATWLANEIVHTFLPMGPLALLSGFFLIVALMTNILTNNATAILFTPIAIAVGRELGGGLEYAFMFATIFGANMSFATPVAYQTNLLVMGPGHYRFFDFVRMGLPLVLLLWVVFTAVAPLFYPGLMQH
jgi:di/tricarboxylate transporter